MKPIQVLKSQMEDNFPSPVVSFVFDNIDYLLQKGLIPVGEFKELKEEYFAKLGVKLIPSSTSINKALVAYCYGQELEFYRSVPIMKGGLRMRYVVLQRVVKR